jgi:hypothetical protein
MTSWSDQDSRLANPDITSVAIPLTRRALLAGTAIFIAGIAGRRPANAQAAGADNATSTFLDVSQAVTGRDGLSPVTAERIYNAMHGDDAGFPGRIEHLAELAQQSASPEALKSAASTVGLDETVMSIVTAWYTGTVQTGKGPVVVAYVDALMYQPVADGLTVPTYCNKGPLWWTGFPPEIATMPQNNPKVL